MDWKAHRKAALREIKRLTRTLRDRPRDAGLFYERALQHWEASDVAGTLADLDEALRLQPEHCAARKRRADMRSIYGDPEEALTDYCELIRMDPQDAEVYCRRAQMHWEVHDYDSALRDWEEARCWNTQIAAKYAEFGDLRSPVLRRFLVEDGRLYSAGDCSVCGEMGHAWTLRCAVSGRYFYWCSACNCAWPEPPVPLEVNAIDPPERYAPQGFDLPTRIELAGAGLVKLIHEVVPLCSRYYSSIRGHIGVRWRSTGDAGAAG